MKTARLTPDSPLTDLSGVGPKKAEQLAASGMTTVGQLVRRLPRAYDDLRSSSPIRDVVGEGPVTVVAQLEAVRTVRTRRRYLSLVQAKAVDETGELRVVWFNQPFIKNQIKPGARYRLHGKLRGRELLNPSLEAESLASATIRPTYPRLGEVGPAAVRRLVQQALERCDWKSISDPLPPKLASKHGLPSLDQALSQLHQPDGEFDLAAYGERRLPAQSRLIYQELLALQLALRGREHGRRTTEKALCCRIDDALRQVVRDLLPFRLTHAQRRVLAEIAQDLQSPAPMQRLLQGDVGCGKTIVAVVALVIALENGFQVALMAPTELLAEQHYDAVSSLLGDRYRMALVTSSSSPETREEVARGTAQLVIGTHSLIQEGLIFDRLALAIVDEQHRFGVEQRESLRKKGQGVDLLVMTATPIPRSLALTAYGDLDLSVIDELPPGRSPVTTTVLARDQRERAYQELETRLERGGRGYVVFPLIETTDAFISSSLLSEGAVLAQRFGRFGVGQLHGRLKMEERWQEMHRFAAGEIKLLLATTVIEVGVDVPEASVMIIEGAERFGLAQLHQLRGRVGRGEEQSVCFAIAGKLSDDGQRRLEVFESSCDGFVIAEEDLSIRGPGEVLGSRQAGVAALGYANPLRDHLWLERAKEDAAVLAQTLDRQGLASLSAALA